jgi:hypothetical protein
VFSKSSSCASVKSFSLTLTSLLWLLFSITRSLLAKLLCNQAYFFFILRSLIVLLVKHMDALSRKMSWPLNYFMFNNLSRQFP